MGRKAFKPLEWLQAIQENCTQRASDDWTFDHDPERLSERWRDMSAKVASLYRELADLQDDSSDRAYGRIYGRVDTDGVKRYRGKEVVL